MYTFDATVEAAQVIFKHYTLIGIVMIIYYKESYKLVTEAYMKVFNRLG